MSRRARVYVALAVVLVVAASGPAVRRSQAFFGLDPASLDRRRSDGVCRQQPHGAARHDDADPRRGAELVPGTGRSHRRLRGADAPRPGRGCVDRFQRFRRDGPAHVGARPLRARAAGGPGLDAVRSRCPAGARRRVRRPSRYRSGRCRLARGVARRACGRVRRPARRSRPPRPARGGGDGGDRPVPRVRDDAGGRGSPRRGGVPGVPHLDRGGAGGVAAAAGRLGRCAQHSRTARRGAPAAPARGCARRARSTGRC